MSLLSLKESVIASVPIPSVGRYTYFIDSVSKQLYVKNNAGTATPVSNFLDTFQLYPAAHSASLISTYTLDLTGKPAPVVGKPINIKVSGTNTFGTIQIVIPTVGTFNLFKIGGVSFAAGELKTDQIITIIIDSGTAYFLSGFVQTSVVQVTNTAALKALMTGGSLTVGTWYQFAFTTQYTLNGAIVSAAAPETMFVRAVATNNVTSLASSAAYPQDIIEIDFNDPTYGAKIRKRRDPLLDLEAPFDWRNVKFRRGKDAISGKYVEYDPAAATFTSDFQDVFCFDNSQVGGGCRAVRIAPQNYNLIVAPGSTYAPWGMIDTNIVFNGPCRNIDILAGCYSLSFYSLGTIAAQNPVVGHGLVIEGTTESLIGQATRGEIVASKNVTIRGQLTPSAQTYTVSLINIEHSETVYLDGTSSKIAIKGCNNVFVGPSNTSLSLEECNNVWITGSTKVNLYGCANSAFKNVVDSTYQQVESFVAVSSIQERVIASRNLASFNVSGCSIESLKDAYQYRDKICNVVAVQAGTPQTIVASIPSAVFAEGDMVAVTNSIALLNKASSIAFDTTADNIPDTASFPIVVADFQQFYPTGLATVAGNFFLLYSNNKFHLLFSVLNCPFKLDTNNSQFDGLTSNISKIVNFNAGAIAVSDPLDYDYGHVGILRVSHPTATDILSQITHTTGKYPKMRRELRNNSVGNTLTIRHGLGANLIATPGGLQRQMNNALDLATLDLDASNQWRVIHSTTADDSSYSQRTVIPLIAGQIQTLNSLPILSVPAPGANKMVRFLNAHLVYRAGATPFAFSGTNLYFRIGGVTVSTTISTATNLDGATSKVIFFNPLEVDFDISSVANAALQLFAEANSALGNGTVTLVVNYRIIELP